MKLKKIFFCLVLVIISARLFPASAIEYGGLGGRPAYPRNDNPRSESIFIHEVEPGETIDEGILVINNKPETKTLWVYAADYIPSTDGGFACKQRSEEKTKVGSWIELEKNELTLGSKTKQVVPFTINVPEKVDVGEHNGCILVQEKQEDRPDKQGVNISMRTGVRVALTIPGELIRELKLLSFEVRPRKNNNNFYLIPEVENTGNVSIDANVKVITKNLFGKQIAEHGGQYSLIRGDVSRWNLELEQPFWGGWYTSQLFVDYQDNGETKSLQSSPVRFFSIPSPKALVYYSGGLLLVLVLIAYLIYKLIKKKRIEKTWIEYEVKKGDDLSSLVDNFNANWKTLVKVNKLKPPYVLKPGQKIKVPPEK